MMRRNLVLVMTGICLCLGVAGGRAVPAQAQGETPVALTLTINGQVNSGTAELTVAPALPVTLHVMRAADAASEPLAVTRYESATDDAGRFRFDAIPAQVGDLIFASLTFDGVQQSSALVSLGAAPLEFSLPVTVYGVTRDPNALVGLDALHTLDVLPGGILQVLSAYRFRNVSDRLYLSEAQTADGAPISAQLPLPVGAMAVAFEASDALRIGGEAMTPIVQDTRAVRPGETLDLVFSYQLPLNGAAIIDQDYPYRTQSVAILVPENTNLRLVGGAPIISQTPDTPRIANFTASADTDINPARPSTRYVLEGELRPGDRLVYTLEGGSVATTAPQRAASVSDGGPSVLALVLFAVVMVSGVLLIVSVLRRGAGSRAR